MATPAQWVAGARPRTLPAAVSPVLVGTGAAAAIDRADLGLALLALIVSLAIHSWIEGGVIAGTFTMSAIEPQGADSNLCSAGVILLNVVVGFMQQFLEIFSELKDKKFYVTGESVRVNFIHPKFPPLITSISYPVCGNVCPL